MTDAIANSLFSYDIVGEITLGLISYNPDKPEIGLDLPLDKVFYSSRIHFDKDIDECAPELTTGVSAFNIRIHNNGRLVTGFIGIIKDITEYKIYHDLRNYDCRVKLRFTYDRVETDYRNKNVPDVPVLLKDVFIYGPFAALFFAGNSDFAVNELGNYRVFCHCSKVYHSYSAYRITKRPAIDMKELVVATVVLASEMEVVGDDDRKQFDNVLKEYISQLYPKTIINR